MNCEIGCGASFMHISVSDYGSFGVNKVYPLILLALSVYLEFLHHRYHRDKWSGCYLPRPHRRHVRNVCENHSVVLVYVLAFGFGVKCGCTVRHEVILSSLRSAIQDPAFHCLRFRPIYGLDRVLEKIR